MTTPYGSTAFYQYVPQGTYQSPPVGLKFTFPDGSTSVIENWIDEPKQSYFWDREAMLRYPNDPANQNYSHCKTTRFLWDASNSMETPVVNYVRSAL